MGSGTVGGGPGTNVGRAAIQVFGGIGFTWELDVHLYDKRLCSQALLGGSEGQHLETIARRTLDQGAASLNSVWMNPMWE